MAINGVSGIGGKFPAPQEPSVPQGLGLAAGTAPSFTRALQIMFDEEKRPFIFTTEHGNIDIGNKLVGTNVDFVSNENIGIIENAMENPIKTAAQSGETSTFMRKV